MRRLQTYQRTRTGRGCGQGDGGQDGKEDVAKAMEDGTVLPIILRL